MQLSDIFINTAGRLRSGWRAFIFTITFMIATSLLYAVNFKIFALIFAYTGIDILGSSLGYIVQAIVLFIPALTIGWACGRLFESLPLKALGWTPHRGWLRDLLLGSFIGALTLILATIIAVSFGGFSFSFNAQGMLFAAAKTLLLSGVIFVLAAAAEEVLFRGYPLQTMTRAQLFLFGTILTSIFFALAHQDNPNLDDPNVYPRLAFANTAIAGAWLAVAYLRTRSLWFPLGVHWAWNWMMAAVIGLPVSGITTLAPTPLLRATDLGPAWLTGGAYGIEGGVACTIAIVVSTILVWRTKLVSATAEMMELTSYEIPRQTKLPHASHEQSFPTDSIQPPPPPPSVTADE